MPKRYDGVEFDNPFLSNLFQTGFINDETPLDDYNLNLVLHAIIDNNDEIEQANRKLDDHQTQLNELNELTGEDGDINKNINSLRALIAKCDDTDVIEREPNVNFNLTIKQGSNNHITSEERGSTVNFIFNTQFSDGTFKYGTKDNPAEHKMG
jgi:hypothetical protein